MAMLSIIGCKKSSNEETDTSSCPIIEIRQKFSRSSDETHTYLKYDGDKIIGYEIKGGDILYWKVALSYSSSKVTKTSQNSNGKTEVYTYNLNSKGFITSATHGTDNATYTYDQKDQLTTIKTVVGSTTLNYTFQYSNGNMVASNRGTFEYNALEPYQNIAAQGHPLVLDNDYLEEFGDFAIVANGNFGVPPKNLVMSRGTYYTYSYEKGASGNITAFSQNDTNNAYRLDFIRKCN